jgi:dTDP-glucose 4,6-dehydratase
MENLLSLDLDHILSRTEALWPAVRGERFFLTGGTGFVGTWLMESLLWANRRLNLRISATVLTRNPAAFERRSPHLACDPAVTLIAGDAASFTFPKAWFPLIVHAATQPYFPPDADHPASVFGCDVASTGRVLEFARRSGVRRLLFTSSGVVYGQQPVGMTHIPEDYPGAPLTTDIHSAYAQAKRASEFLCLSAGQACGFDVLVARLFAFAGPYLPLDANFAVGNFIRDVLAGGPIRISGDGTPYRSYLYAADLAIWLWTILLRAEPGRVYNVGSEDAIGIAALAARVASALGSNSAITVAQQPQPGIPARRYIPSTLRARAELGLEQSVSLDEALRRTAAFALGGATARLHSRLSTPPHSEPRPLGSGCASSHDVPFTSPTCAGGAR